jgi:hypothetical protein
MAPLESTAAGLRSGKLDLAAYLNEVCDRIESVEPRLQSLLPEACRSHLRPPIRLRVRDWYSAMLPRDDVQPPRLRRLSGELAAAALVHAPETGAVPGALWPDPRLWNDPVVAVLATMEALVARDIDARGQAQLAQARGMLEHALQIFPESAATHFDLGLVAWLQGDMALARRAFELAASHDGAPASANDRINDSVRAVAARVPGVTLLDAEAWFEGCTPDGIVGYEMMMDSCHLQPGARGVLMQRFAEVLGALAAAESGPPPPGRAGERPEPETR